MGGVGGPCDFSVSPSPFGLDFGTLDFGTSDLGLTKKKVDICQLRGGGVKKLRNVNFLKVVFKIHFKLF